MDKLIESTTNNWMLLLDTSRGTGPDRQGDVSMNYAKVVMRIRRDTGKAKQLQHLEVAK